VAAAYDGGRPGYPEALIDECIRLAGLPPGGRILEIGCGTGQATRSFAGRGFRMVCLEPGPNLAVLARRNLAAFPNVVVLGGRFEDWPVEPEAFDLVLAATSLHHVDEGVRYGKTARALKPGGSLAVIGNAPDADADPADFRAELDRIYARWWGAESAREYAELTLERRIAAKREEIERSGLFARIETSCHPWTVEYDADRYLSLLDSDSGRLKHPAEAQKGLKADIAAAIARRGGTVYRGYVAVLVLAHRSSERA
jgi:SAM-dependent methyltransferase